MNLERRHQMLVNACHELRGAQKTYMQVRENGTQEEKDKYGQNVRLAAEKLDEILQKEEGIEIKNAYSVIPPRVKTILRISEGWLVGASLEQLMEGKVPKDYDILVPDAELFQKTVLHLREDFGEPTLNTFGGLKFKDERTISIDIWCEELNHFLMNGGRCKYMYNLEDRIMLTM